MSNRLKTSLRQVIEFLETKDYSYAIIGGIALSHWGVVRTTYDIDIKLTVPDNDYQTVRTDLQQAFPQAARVELPPNPLIVAVSVDDVIVDFLLALPGYEELIIDRAVELDMGGWSAWVSTAEDLIIQKVVAGRTKDWQDIEELLVEQAGLLETEYIEEWLHQFGEALDNPDLFDTYRNVVNRVESELTR